MNIEVLVSDADDSIKTYQDAINLAGQALVEKGHIQKGYIQACIDREEEFPTGLLFANGNGIAIPHSNAELVQQSSISVVRLAHNNIEFGLMEDASQKVNCNLIFNLALNSGQQHLVTLRKLISLFQDDNFITKCQKLDTQDAAKFIADSLTH